ncbi:ATP-binding cassette domain-containing protein [Gracilibacillus alcaliphilus]|uniref:ATP-binding cassette domain-containing protein n=1 Tax=Gracilibacillus alcaliphilus TaxID=1401441 RepID=UPI00195766B8|nr:ABC transporter ATP-binding protein [Gracilibacillus alcaliphilus]MBM7679087.1 ABC-2 type transport system ATP-binding protein [Gracilibacillus alcaliphilus]
MGYSVEVKDVTLSYKQFKAIDQLSFRLTANKIHGLLGRNGAGKTTLLTVLASFRPAKQGTVLIDGEDPFENERIMEGTAFIYDQDHTYNYDKVDTLLKEMRYFRPNYDVEYAHSLAKKFKIPLDKGLDQLSKGKQSAFQATIGLASRAPLTIFDEAYLGMDAPTRELFYQEILAEQERYPRTIIFSTHLVSEMDYLFDEILIINEGKLLLQDSNERVMEKGVSITGAQADVESFTDTLEVINSHSLGGTKSVMVYGALTEQQQREAQELGLEIGRLSLHDLFVHVTKEEES